MVLPAWIVRSTGMTRVTGKVNPGLARDGLEGILVGMNKLGYPSLARRRAAGHELVLEDSRHERNTAVDPHPVDDKCRAEPLVGHLIQSPGHPGLVATQAAGDLAGGGRFRGRALLMTASSGVKRNSTSS